MTLAALLLAVALLIRVHSSRSRLRTVAASGGASTAAARTGDPLALASTLDVLAACLRSGMPVSTAASAAVSSAPPQLAGPLDRAAHLLALGAHPSTVWSSPAETADRHIEAFMRLARRSAASGMALAQGIEELAARSRDDAADDARAAAERASVLIAGPLGGCYLPAFVCLGIVPVVAGLAGDVLQSGLL
ncbi:type II secretion system F family protein [Mycobacterium sp. IDR2000157661]|uniref:type II secretion system F family protein n=1 Tax=Mycobacterium sp. IDR2000157661 TaxID=2867005 RepID=UPI001EEE258D|nr:type II secretion system F family protein [Mycobacterium sp. IDR2000157661]ULE35057.1 type II secretion system F family protein [Mycobacterium sp. IDR2000157661]